MDIARKKIELPTDELRKLGVALAYLFGSQAEGAAGPSSDIDVGVVFSDPAALAGDTSETYNRLYNVFSDVFDMENFRNMDIVFLERAPLELRFDAITHGIPLFEASSDVRLDFEERTAALYRDFQPLLREFNRAVMERI